MPRTRTSSSDSSGSRAFVVKGTRFHVDSRYEIRAPLGHGTYGVCAVAADLHENSLVAIKKVSNAFEDAIDSRRILREVSLLRHFAGHENILGLRDLMISCRPEPRDMYLVTEVMDTDLHQVIRSGQELTDDHCQWFSYQLLRGLKALHSAGVLHRDLKPANLLVNKNCDLKICDFGLARGIAATTAAPESATESAADDDAAAETREPELTEYVVTRWYRAPELLICAEHYGAAIDIWSAGCIVAEMLGRRPLLPGRDHLHQLRLVLRLLGTPAREEMDRLSSLGDPQAWAYIHTLPRSARVALSALFPHANPKVLRLVRSLLALDPAARASAADALGAPYFADLHQVNDEPGAPPFAFPRDVERRDVSVATLRELLSAEHARYHPGAGAGSLWKDETAAAPERPGPWLALSKRRSGAAA